MKNKKLLYKILTTVVVVLALICNGLPLVSMELFGIGGSITAFSFFHMEYMEDLLEFASETNVIAVAKAIIIAFIALDILSGILVWATKKKALYFVEILTGLLQAGWWLFVVTVACKVPDIRDMLDGALSFGIGLWGFIITGIVMIVLGICLLIYKGKEVSFGAEAGALIGVSGEYAGARIPIGKVPVVLGRDQTNSHVILQDESISRQHCSVVYDAERKIYIVRDLSSNGTFLSGGSRLPANQANELKSGEQIRIGKKDVFSLL